MPSLTLTQPHRPTGLLTLLLALLLALLGAKPTPGDFLSLWHAMPGQSLVNPLPHQGNTPIAARLTVKMSYDPIGIRGGVRPQAYVPNPTTYIDPLGLTCCWTRTGQTQRLYRAVGVREYESIMRTGRFDPMGASMEGRQFGLTAQEALDFARADPSKVAIIGVDVDTGALSHFDFSNTIDPFIFKNGVYTIQPGAQSEIFHEAITGITHVE